MSSPDLLAAAVRKGDLQGVRKALRAGASATEDRDSWGWPLVHVAALRGHLAVARLLWESDVKKDPRRLRRALHLALQSGNEEVIRYFLDQGAAPSEVFKALYLGSLPALRSALKADPGGVGARDEDGQTPLHVAANMNRKEAASLLIEAGAEIDARDSRGETPFFRSISDDAQSVARLLLKHGADINTVTACGQNALHCAATTHRRQLVKLLESRGIDPRFDDIHVASALGRLERVKTLLGDDPSLCDRQDVLGATPLHWSVAHRKKDVAEYLLSRGADPNIRDSRQRTPLFAATQRKDKEIIRLLVQYGAGH